MPIASFDELTGGLCELAGTALPLARTNGHGGRWTDIALHDAEITVLEVPAIRPGAVFLMCSFGPLCGPNEHEQTLALLHANFELLGEPCAPFGLHADTGEAVLQQALLLESCDLVDAYRQCCGIALARGEWLATGHVDPGRIRAHRHVAGGDEALARSREERFSALRRAAGGNASAVSAGWRRDRRDGPAFALRTGVGTVHVGLPAHLEDRLSIAVSLDPAAAPEDDGMLRRLLESNFSLMTNRHGAAFSRDAGSGQLLMQFACPFDSDDPVGVLRTIARLAADAARRHGRLAAASVASKAWLRPSPGILHSQPRHSWNPVFV